MQPAIWTSYFIEQSPEEMVDTFASGPWRVLELSTEHGEALLERGNPERTGAAFREYASSQGVTFPQGHLWLTADITASDQQPVIDRLRTWLDLFVAAGVNAAVLHPSRTPLREETRPDRQMLDLRVAALGALTAHLDGTGTAICLENVSAAPRLADLLLILDAVRSPNLGLCLDTGHLNLADGDQAAFIRGAGTHLKALHIADNEGQTDQHLMPYGRGTVDWPTVVDELKHQEYSGLFNLEIPGENRAPLEVRMAKLAYLRELLRIMLG
jgi:sugar phosphate isomerase/epimerase